MVSDVTAAALIPVRLWELKPIELEAAASADFTWLKVTVPGVPPSPQLTQAAPW